MNAIYLGKKSGPESLIWGDLPRPTPNAGEVLIKVYATAVTPTELNWDPTFNQPSGQPRPFPIVLSHEFSGVVDSLGANVRDFAVGDEVFGLNDWFANGAQAEYCVASAASLAPKPKSLDHSEAAVVPISALTAWQGLFEKAHLERAQRVLIHGAAGGVGTFAVQLARWRGAHVTATASAANIEFVRALGADAVIDYHATRFEDVICDVDVVFDGVGGETLQRSWSVLKPGGTLVTIVGAPGAADQRSRDAFMLVRADGRQLAQLGKMIDAGELRVFVETVLPLADATEAYARAQEGGLRGKIVLDVNAESRMTGQIG
ncbi:MAG TPA: NADP-dependent oxidoreductase [Verrucomicrobiae bacterium]|jgi:NADPH:quinone reductase-like Zn-dependent oxidoreductase|nr:NADP-dependent oxidoreductase [Verrucomicrobiae bacterium]